MPEKSAKKIYVRPVASNSGIRNQYRRLLQKMIRELAEEVSKALKTQYGEEAPEITQDASPAEKLSALLEAARTRFELKAAKEAPTLAKFFLGRVVKNVDKRQTEAMKAAGLGDFLVGFGGFGAVKRDVVDALFAENVSLIKSIGREYLERVTGQVMRAVTGGSDLKTLAKELRQSYGISSRRAVTIARDQTNKATESISRANNLDAGIEYGEWIHIPGRKSSRKSHEAMHGKVFRLDKGCLVEDPSDPDYGKYIMPGHPVNCFPAWSQVDGSPFPNKLFRHRFSGVLTKIVTENGTVLNATPNHPVLTSKGWKAASLVNDGDYLIQKKGANRDIRAELDADNRVSAIGDLFDAFDRALGCSRIALSPASHFHGDMTDGEVDVVDVASLLTDDLITSVFECGEKFALSPSEVTDVVRLFSGLRPSDKFVMRLRNASDSVMSGFCKRLSLFYRSLTHAQKCGFFAIADRYSSRLESSSDGVARAAESLGDFQFGMACLIHGDDFFARNIEAITRSAMDGNLNASLPKIDADVLGAHADHLGDLDKRFATGYCFDRVVKVGVCEMVSHVFNLETVSGWYIANNVIVHNCNCSYRAVFDPSKWKET